MHVVQFWGWSDNLLFWTICYFRKLLFLKNGSIDRILTFLSTQLWDLVVVWVATDFDIVKFWSIFGRVTNLLDIQCSIQHQCKISSHYEELKFLGNGCVFGLWESLVDPHVVYYLYSEGISFLRFLMLGFRVPYSLSSHLAFLDPFSMIDLPIVHSPSLRYHPIFTLALFWEWWWVAFLRLGCFCGANFLEELECTSWERCMHICLKNYAIFILERERST
jgi:hypothetical protein